MRRPALALHFGSGLAFAVAILAVPFAARADVGPLSKPKKDDRTVEPPKFPASVDDLSAPRLPPPFVLPELSHPSWDVALGWLVGVASPERADRTTPALGLARFTAEGDLFFPRRFYVGVTLPFASALAPDATSGAKTVFGNVEAHVRVAFPLPTWLAFGAVLGVVAPTARYDHGTGAEAASTMAASLEPTDAVHFAPDTFALRPAMDVRVLRGPFVVQVRQGVDVVLDTAAGRAVTVGRLLGHAGLRVRRDVEVSIEATQRYTFDDRVSDQRRSAMTIGPGVRLSLGIVDVGAAMLTNVFHPLSGDIDRFVALRLSLVAHLE
ncbi:MAG: hypothetical protein JWO86_4387 [Myxococcaceae bacterium]|nr:hypothetical protein [Myxococcaceae bacterium]